MKLTWLEQAELDVRRLYQFLAKINRDAAERAIETILEASVTSLQTSRNRARSQYKPELP